MNRPVGIGRTGRASAHRVVAAARVLLACLAAAPPVAGQDAPQTQTDDYTRYELLEPGSGAFRIFYDVSATTPGARFYYNTIRAGAEEVVHGVTDLYTGEPLAWEVVDGRQARAGGHPRAAEDGRYIKVTLSRPVPADGQGRIRIDKTYIDPDSYYVEGDEVVFSRSLGIRRNAVVLPRGYELVECNYPCQVRREDDGRIAASFMSPGPAAVPFRVRGRPLSDPGEHAPARRAPAEVWERKPASEIAGARVGWAFPERAFEDRDITYYLLSPETHSFRLYHDYTETRAGVDRYVNVVRPGSRATDPAATLLDTGESLAVETLRGEEIARRGVDLGEAPTADTEVVLISFEPVRPGHSVRLRIWETYADPGRYRLVDGDLVWDRSFGRARDTVVLPEGWYLTANAIPGLIDELDDGRIRLRYINPRPDEIRVFLMGRHR